MDVADVARRLRLAAEDDVLSRARELLRLSHGRVRPQARIALPVVCLDVACAELGAPIDRAAAIRVAAVTPKIYTDALKSIAASLAQGRYIARGSAHTAHHATYGGAGGADRRARAGAARGRRSDPP